jgi:hypothetical protein
MKTIKCVIVLCLLNFTVLAQTEVKEVSQDWVAFTQTLDVESKTRKKFKVTASVKVETDDEQAWAGVWARVDNKEEMGFFDNMGDRPIKINKWQSYTIEGFIDENAKRLNFGGLCIMNGKFYFDNYKLFIENDKGELEEVPIDNASFETTISNNVIPKWSQGISKGKIIKVKEYNVTSTADVVNGDFALLFVGSGMKPEITSIGDVEGASPQIASMISMLEDLKQRVESRVKNMTPYQLDHLHDDEANRIGALIMHLAAAEKFYQVFTFEGRMFNEEEKKKWDTALNLDQGGRDEFKGHDVQYYLDIYNEVRAKTIEELKKRDDKWFKEIQPAYGWTNHYCWFHVMEHQSSHLGQILFLAKRIPPEPEIKLPETIKD